jgi:hypothetical protein
MPSRTDSERLIQLIFEEKPLCDQSRDYQNRDVSRKLCVEVAEELKE